jgi:hypothetical protein
LFIHRPSPHTLPTPTPSQQDLANAFDHLSASCLAPVAARLLLVLAISAAFFAILSVGIN